MTGPIDYEIETAGDEERAIMERFTDLASLPGDPGITLTNIYKEIPISHPASICEVKARHLELTTSELQLAAICQCKEVYIRSPHLERPVLARLDSMDIRRNLVQLSGFSYREVGEEQRRTVRVRFRKPVGVVVHTHAHRVSGMIHDISLGGCCINTMTLNGLLEAEQLEVELRLYEVGAGAECPPIPSDLAQVRGESSPFKCVFLFRHTQQSEQALSVYINQRQLEILRELRETL